MYFPSNSDSSCLDWKFTYLLISAVNCMICYFICISAIVWLNWQPPRWRVYDYVRHKTSKRQRQTKKMATITPNRPTALPKISMMRTLTNSVLFCASANAPPDPTIPTHRPQPRLLKPAIIPAPNIMYPARSQARKYRGVTPRNKT